MVCDLNTLLDEYFYREKLMMKYLLAEDFHQIINQMNLDGMSRAQK